MKNSSSSSSGSRKRKKFLEPTTYKMIQANVWEYRNGKTYKTICATNWCHIARANGGTMELQNLHLEMVDTLKVQM